MKINKRSFDESKLNNGEIISNLNRCYMNGNNNQNGPNVSPHVHASAFCGCVSRRSDDLRAAILTGNEINMASAIQESIERTFGEINSETKSK